MSDVLTLDQQIRADIEERIRSGEWPPGFRIPFEHELVRSYNCSRATVSKAMEKLANSGLIERRRRAGSFVARPHIESAILEVPDLAEIVARRGDVYHWQLERRREMRGAGDLAGPVLYVTGVHYSGREPLALENRTLSLTAVPEAAEQDFGEIAPGSWLLNRIPWTDARHRIRAVEASAEDAARLLIAPMSACLSIDRTTWRAGEAVTQVRHLFPGSRYDLVAEFESAS
ncbi:UTRA domain-containing protein [Stakelama sp. CBK3Z-3]|uniref:UTRA domain-containing protein n=1 Tax=Stakelama flava TaxID=2860338 RepID=A0ABS6XKR1_9SPHN|nr:UTRA domain-containing protein [Stakelama flava]MBW4330403.1 UTRA domain-containing protein [Stakelama flava]